MLLKSLIFRAYSFTLTAIVARVWFGDWHVAPFQVFLLVYCTGIYYVFEVVWSKCNEA